MGKYKNRVDMLGVMLGNDGGGELITGTVAVEGDWQVLVVNEDAVIEEIKVNDVDVTAVRGFDGKTLSAGIVVGAGGDIEDRTFNLITSVKLVSGSVMVY